MKYDSKGTSPCGYREGWLLVLKNQKRLQHLISHYLYGHYDLGGLIPPPRSKFELIGMNSDLILPEARYLLRSIDDVDWKNSIKMMLSNCKAVIVECSHWSDSLAWEISEVIRVKGLKNIILVANETNIDNAKRVQTEILSLAKKITKRKKLSKLKILTHRYSRFGDVDLKFKSELIKSLEHIAPVSNRSKRKMLFVSHMRLGLGYIWMSTIAVFVVYLFRSLYKF